MPRPVAKHTVTRGFTIIEVMVVIAIIVILLAITVSVGISVKANASIRSTHATLKALDGMMKDYLATGNPEPTVPSSWPYTSNPTAAYAATNPPSDVTTWVKVLQSDPNLAKQLSNLPHGSDGLSPANTVILDAFGTPIRYVPTDPNTKKVGYFMSAGPDRNFSTSTPPSGPNLAADDLYSYDP